MLSRFAIAYEKACRGILVVFLVNVALLVYTVLGAVVVGLMPAVAAAYATFRSLIMAEDHSWGIRQVWTTFGRIWRSELVGANLAGWPITAVGLLLVLDYRIANYLDPSALGWAASGLLLMALAGYLLFCSLFWVVRANNFAERTWWQVRATLGLVLARPLCRLLTAAVLGVTGWLWWNWPVTLFTFGAAVPIFAICCAVFSTGRLPRMRQVEAPIVDPMADANWLAASKP